MNKSTVNTAMIMVMVLWKLVQIFKMADLTARLFLLLLFLFVLVAHL